MHVVGIYGLGQDKEPLVGPLAAAWGRTNYEALARLRTPGDGPLVVAFFAAEEQAERLAARLRSAGFSALVLTPGEIEDEGRARVVRQFELGDREFLVEAEKSGRLSVPFLDIDLILRGTGVAVTVSTEISKNRSLSLGPCSRSLGDCMGRPKRKGSRCPMTLPAKRPVLRRSWSWLVRRSGG